eukprot:jgi/Botrbrau1/8618/Bobra.0196s0015.1
MAYPCPTCCVCAHPNTTESAQSEVIASQFSAEPAHEGLIVIAIANFARSDLTPVGPRVTTSDSLGAIRVPSPGRNAPGLCQWNSCTMLQTGRCAVEVLHCYEQVKGRGLFYEQVWKGIWRGMAGSPSSSRPFEIIVWGGTGFTGRLVAEHIARNYQSAERPLKWALAGRNAAKLEDVKKSLIAINPDCKRNTATYRGYLCLTANIADAASVDRLLASTKVVVAMAGPYALYGSAIVASAVRQGTHYLDITGETFWVKQLIDLHHEEAARKGVKIVPMCGYESLPSDITTLMAVDHLQKKYGKKTGSVLQAFEHEGHCICEWGHYSQYFKFSPESHFERSAWT